jgi:hypothetical protein
MYDFSKLTSEALATRVVLFRTLGFQRDASVAAMNELTIRKAAGDSFDYERWIEEEIKKFPNLKQNGR